MNSHLWGARVSVTREMCDWLPMLYAISVVNVLGLSAVYLQGERDCTEHAHLSHFFWSSIIFTDTLSLSERSDRPDNRSHDTGPDIPWGNADPVQCTCGLAFCIFTVSVFYLLILYLLHRTISLLPWQLSSYLYY